MILVQLGKYGDIINVLPLAFMLHKKLGGRIKWMVGKQWASILEGVSYVEPFVFNGTDDDLPLALSTYRGQQKLVTQAWKNFDQVRETDSFAKEQWRYAGSLSELGKWPLIFDKRDKEREQSLANRFAPLNKKPIVLCAARAKSVPYKGEFKLVATLREELDADVIDISADIAHRLYDFIGLYDVADLLVTVDTCHAHLARASYCPVIMLQADGWMGAPPPPQAIAHWRYGELADTIGPSPVVASAKKQLARKVESVAVVFNSHNTISDRHQRAGLTHPRDAIYAKYDYRPSLKQLLGQGLNSHKDVVIFTNDDVTFLPDTLDKIRKHAQKFDFGCSRRSDGHIGREIFWFRDDWLRKHWYWLPNPYWSVQKCDLILCRWLRHQKDIPSTLENLQYDFPPVDVPDAIYHEDHPSHWTAPEVANSMEAQFNERMWEAGI